MFIKVENGRVTGLFSGQKPHGGDYRDVPDHYAGMNGMDIREFAEDWTIRPLSWRVGHGYVQLRPEEKLVGEEIIRKSELELIKDGLVPAPAGMKLHAGALVPISLDERYQAGLIEKSEYERLKAETAVTAELDYLATTDWYVVRHAETGQVIPAGISDRRATARDRINQLRARLALIEARE